ncbi:hypothetical protein CIL03_08475 [Virgibacillus indicus]|uniref:Uncharacterized protein n=1 Tax=Virgibacillus indicus TaxID=2024554 RepID=A0A265NAI3_9BACI|nr:hypothetical protein [Virgibacillus indicus]OZU89042.1 hypothetical protein CIL03_08475 [Virgibacillus indicus]
MKTSLFNFKLLATKMYIPELEKGESNPYTTGDEAGNPYMKDIVIEIQEKHFLEILGLLKQMGYDTSKMM